MQFKEAQQYVGANCEVAWRDRHGNLQSQAVFVMDVSFVPLYGICLITDCQEIRLDRVVSIQTQEQQARAVA